MRQEKELKGVRETLTDGLDKKYPNRLEPSEKLLVATYRLERPSTADLARFGERFGFDTDRTNQVLRIGIAQNMYSDIHRLVDSDPLVQPHDKPVTAQRPDRSSRILKPEEQRRLEQQSPAPTLASMPPIATGTFGPPVEAWRSFFSSDESEVDLVNGLTASITSRTNGNHKNGRRKGNGTNSEEHGSEELDILPEAERMFYIGLGLGDYQLSSSDENSLILLTGSQGRKREVLRQTIGTRALDGRVLDGSRDMRIHLDPNLFGFMKDDDVPYSGIIVREESFAPFLLGVLAAKLSEAGNRLSFTNDSLLKRIHTRFQELSSFELGRFSLEENRENPISVVQVKDPHRVFGYLFNTKSVRELPFYKDLKQLMFDTFSEDTKQDRPPGPRRILDLAPALKPGEKLEGDLPSNQTAFFEGFGFGDHRAEARIFPTPRVLVITDTQKQNKQMLIHETIGRWGEPETSSEGIRYSLETPKFDFLIKRQDSEKIDRIIKNKDLYAPFLMGVILARMSEGGIISSQNQELLSSIYDRFNGHFGFSMGRFAIEGRLAKIYVEDQDDLTRLLLTRRSVASLPFIENVLPSFAQQPAEA